MAGTRIVWPNSRAQVPKVRLGCCCLRCIGRRHPVPQDRRQYRQLCCWHTWYGIRWWNPSRSGYTPMTAAMRRTGEGRRAPASKAPPPPARRSLHQNVNNKPAGDKIKDHPFFWPGKSLSSAVLSKSQGKIPIVHAPILSEGAGNMGMANTAREKAC